jgi:PAS domain S-box-containing protein
MGLVEKCRNERMVQALITFSNLFKMLPVVELYRRLSIACAVILIFFGIMVIGAWHFQFIHHLQIGTTVVPVYNTGLSFLLCGLSIFLIQHHKKWIVLGCMGVVVALSVITALQFILEINLGVDELFLPAYTAVSNPFPGRMSPFTVFSFITAAAGFLLLSFKSTRKWGLITTIFLAQLIVVVCFIAVAGYLLGILTAYRINTLTPIAIHTASMFVILGTAITLLSHYLSLRKNVDLDAWRPIFFTFKSIMATLFLSGAIYINENLVLKETLQKNLKEIIFEVDEALAKFTHISERMRNRWLYLVQVSPDKVPEILKHEAVMFTTTLPEISAVLFVDKNFNPFACQSRENNCEGLLKDLEKEKETLEKNLNPPQKMFSLPSKNGQFTYLTPVYDQEKMMGFFVFSLDMTKFFLQHTPPWVLESYSIVVKAKKKIIFQNTLDPKEGLFANEEKKVINDVWKIEIWPSKAESSRNRTILPAMTFFLGMIITFFLFLSLRNAQLIRASTQKLKKSQEILMRAQKIARIGTWTWDLSKDIIQISQEAKAILGLGSDQGKMASDTFFQLIHPNDYHRLEDQIKQMRSGRAAILETFSIIRPDNQRRYVRLDARVTNFHYSYPLEITGVIQDITDFKELEMSFAQTQKVELLGQLTGGIAHDFNNILMVIQGNLELLAMKMPDETPEKKKIEIAIAASERGSDLVKRLLAFSRKQELNPKVIDVKAFLNETMKLLKRPLGEAINLTYDVCDNVWPILVDSSQLENAIINLAVNARDAMNGKGDLKIAVRNASVDSALHTRFGLVEAGDYVEISVTDSGIGIAENIIDHIFEPFFTTKEVGKGSGLGLSMVYGFITQSQGHIDVQSELGKGTTIRFYLPRAEDSLTLENPEEDSSAKVSEQGETILIVEDETEVREVAIEYLKQLKYTVLSAVNGDEALEIAKKYKEIDLLFTDVVMPGHLSGPELGQEIKKVIPSIKIIFTSGYLKNEKLKQGDSFIKKPYRMKDLAELIQTVLKDNGASG